MAWLCGRCRRCGAISSVRSPRCLSRHYSLHAACRYAVARGIRLKYFPCQDGKGRGFGPHHDWAMGLRSSASLAATPSSAASTASATPDDVQDVGM